MTQKPNFKARLENKVKQQIKGARVGFLLGAGSSYLAGDGYPLASELWGNIKKYVPAKERSDIHKKIKSGATGLENALDLLDKGGNQETRHRHCVTDAISRHFSGLRPPLEVHGKLAVSLSKRNERAVPIFSLNYDPLIERACESYLVRFVDGFVGIEHAYFEPATFQQHIVTTVRGPRGPVNRPVKGLIRLYKLHGSLGWYECPRDGIRRCIFDAEIPVDAKRLMVPPQHRKAVDTTAQPYASVWSEFREMLAQGPRLINRLVSIGYGMLDEHVNSVIENGLSRTNFTLLILTRELTDEAFARWGSKRNVIIVTEKCCSLYGQKGLGHPDFWSFEKLSGEV